MLDMLLHRLRPALAAASLSLGFAVGGCAEIATFAKADAGNAGAMAANAAKAGDAQAATRGACYTAFGNVAGGVAAAPANSIGVFTAVESGIEIQGTINRPECQAISGQVMLWLLRKAPGGNLLP
jgi:hypothetical protein